MYSWKTNDDNTDGVLDLMNLSYPISDSCTLTKLKPSRTVKEFENIMFKLKNKANMDNHAQNASLNHDEDSQQYIILLNLDFSDNLSDD